MIMAGVMALAIILLTRETRGELGVTWNTASRADLTILHVRLRHPLPPSTEAEEIDWRSSPPMPVGR